MIPSSLIFRMISEVQSMISKINKVSTPGQSPVEVNSITMETKTEDMLIQPPSSKDSSVAVEAKSNLNIEANLRRSVIERDLDLPDMATKTYQDQSDQDICSAIREKPKKKDVTF